MKSTNKGRTWSSPGTWFWAEGDLQTESPYEGSGVTENVWDLKGKLQLKIKNHGGNLTSK